MSTKTSMFKETARSLWSDRFARFGFFVIGLYLLTMLLDRFGVFSIHFSEQVGSSYGAPSSRFWLGTDYLGRDVLAKVLHGIEIAFSVGFIASLVAIPIGVILGATAGYFGGWVDEVVVWFFSTADSIPQILLLIALSFVIGPGLSTIYIAVGLTSWVPVCRVIRSEVLKQKELEYVLAARALGAGDFAILWRHILPNVTHIVIIDFSLRFIYAIKSEAVLSYLGLGVQAGETSWGRMIADSKEELLNGIWWQLAGATTAMFFLVLAFNLIGDALRDALDPRLRD